MCIADTAPVPTTVIVGGGTLTDNELRIYFNKAINLLIPPVEEDFTTTFSGGAVAVSSVMLYEDGGEYFVDLLLSRSITYGETGTVEYTGTDLVGDNGKTVAAFTEDVTNNVTATYENDFTEIIIESQIWMKYNLVEDGTPYDDTNSNLGLYGALYTWDEAVASALAIDGWHLPTEEEWNVLLTVITGDTYGHTLKIADETYWNDITGHTDTNEFSARGAGYYDGVLLNYGGLKDQANFWSATEDGETAFFVSLFKNESLALYSGYDNKAHKASIRLLKDYYAPAAHSVIMSISKTGFEIQFDNYIDTEIPALSAFSLTEDDVPFDISAGSVEFVENNETGGLINFALGGEAEFTDGKTYKVIYTKPETNPLKGLFGGLETEAFTETILWEEP